jgi:hypothetical protein
VQNGFNPGPVNLSDVLDIPDIVPGAINFLRAAQKRAGLLPEAYCENSGSNSPGVSSNRLKNAGCAEWPVIPWLTLLNWSTSNLWIL